MGMSVIDFDEEKMQEAMKRKRKSCCFFILFYFNSCAYNIVNCALLCSDIAVKLADLRNQLDQAASSQFPDTIASPRPPSIAMPCRMHHCSIALLINGFWFFFLAIYLFIHIIYRIYSYVTLESASICK